ncbi:MAG: hypothetical protein EP330_20210 [Deltaproteobacteria bacterium]|nr:MAG: hypothetical protein EP330_20210 [Deltaproteobacteria bacterium]
MNALSAIAVWFAATFGGHAPVECNSFDRDVEICEIQRSYDKSEDESQSSDDSRRSVRETTWGFSISNGF